MELLKKPPQQVLDALPNDVAEFLQNGGWFAVLGIGAFLVLLILYMILGSIGRALFGRKEEKPKIPNLTVNFAAIPEPPRLTGDRRLQFEGVPVRLRLVILAPAGRDKMVDPASAKVLLESMVPGLGDVQDQDQPQVVVWPEQLSNAGFCNTFQKATPIPEGERQPSRWILAAGRARLSSGFIQVGLAMQSIKPTTLGRFRLEDHQWPQYLRVRTRD
ncbi:MAG: OadG family protein [Gemmataceae bacterium]